MVKQMDEKNFSMVKRARSFTYAWRGMLIFIKTGHNAWLQIGIFLVALFFGIIWHITRTDWLAFILVSGLVLTSEAFNTALEIDINLTSPQYHPYARDIKDVAAGAVLISSVTAFVVGVFIYLPHLLRIFKLL